MYASDIPVQNNSAILADTEGHIGTVYCTSGLHASGIGEWFAPDGVKVSGSGDSSFTVFRGGGNFPSFIALQLKTNKLLKTSDEGIYECIIPDENNRTETLYAGLYNHDHYGNFY